jgi:hypothetical protein
MRYKNKTWKASDIADYFGCRIVVAKFIYKRYQNKQITAEDLFECQYTNKEKYIYTDKRGNRFNVRKLVKILDIGRNTAYERLKSMIKGEIDTDTFFKPLLKKRNLTIRAIAEYFYCSDETATFLKERVDNGHITSRELFMESKDVKNRIIYKSHNGRIFDSDRIMMLVGIKHTGARKRLYLAKAGKITIDLLLAPPGSSLQSSRKFKNARHERLATQRLNELRAAIHQTPQNILDLDDKYFGYIKPKNS